jgi:transposase
MRFEEAYDGWRSRRLLQEEAAQLLGVCERTFRRYIDRFEDSGLDGLIDKRLAQVSSLRAPVDEVMALEALYRERYDGWNVQHFFERYRSEHQGERGYTWVKQRLQAAKAVVRGKRKGTHRKRRERAPLAGMMIHQDGSRHRWVGERMWDLIVTMDDATSEVYSAFFVEEEGTWSSFRGVKETLERQGVFSSFYSDRGSHYWYTPKAGGAVERSLPTQFGRAMGQLGITMIAAHSPQARGRSERMFKTLQDRLPKELVLQGITGMEAANHFLVKRFLPAFNRRFAVTAAEQGSAFVPLMGVDLEEILCLKTERTAGNDNCVSYHGKVLQLPKVRGRCHFAKSVVTVHQYADGRLAVYHGPRVIARYEASGVLSARAAEQTLEEAA